MSSLDGIDAEVESALSDLRKDPSSSGFDWVLVGFENADNSHLKLLGSGSGGISALAAIVPEADIAYGVLRKEFDYDTVTGMGTASVTKFLRICWRPEAKIPIKRKMKVGVLDGAIKKILGSTHADIEAEVQSELTEAIVLDLIQRITQTKDNSAAAEGKQASTFLMGGVAANGRTATGDSKSAKQKQDGYLQVSTGAAQGAEVSFEDLEGIQAAIARVRDDKNKDVNWMLTGYKDKKTIELIGEGPGDVQEMLLACKPGTVCYGIFRIVEQIDKTEAVKFCFLVWQPDDVPVMARAAISTHKGAVVPLFRPFHVDFQVTLPGELNHDKVMDRVMSLSGTKSHVTDKKVEVKQEVYEKKTLGGGGGGVQVEFVDKDAIVNAVKQVRNDKETSVEWAVTSWEAEGKTLKLALKSTGDGGLNGFKEALCADRTNMSYGILRQTKVVELAEQVKFLFVTYQGEEIALGIKSQVGTLKGGVLPLFQPFHGEVFVDSKEELTEDVVAKNLWKF